MTTPPVIGPDSRLVLRRLSVVPDADGEYLVGDPDTGTFVALPSVGVTVIDQLRDGVSVAEAGRVASADVGADVDAVDFANTLLDLGFVAEVDGAPTAVETTERKPRWIAVVAPELARPLFSPVAWVVYGLLFVGCAVVLLALPQYRPHAEDVFFLSTPVISVGVLAVWGMFSTALHEIAHWLGARAEGVPARFSIGRRLYFVVFETDLSQLWSLPRRRRFGPLLAGLAFDTVLISVLLAIQLVAGPGRLSDVAAALLAIEFTGALFQFLVFLRTDLYAVLVMLCGCRNLWRVNGLQLRKLFGRLTEEQATELADAHPRDLRVASWFRWLSIAGLAASAGYFVAFFLPALWTLFGWIGASLAEAGPTSGRFWQSAVFSVLALIPVLLPVWVWIRDRRRAAATAA